MSQVPSQFVSTVTLNPYSVISYLTLPISGNTRNCDEFKANVKMSMEVIVNNTDTMCLCKQMNIYSN